MGGSCLEEREMKLGFEQAVWLRQTVNFHTVSCGPTHTIQTKKAA
jgi:hypothetical protein